MKSLSRHFASTAALAVVLSLGLPPELRADATASGGPVSLLHDEPGHGGGRVTGGLVTIDTSTGGAIAGGLAEAAAEEIGDKGGYTGQLYDVRDFALSASSGTTLIEGNAVMLTANKFLDDGTKIESSTPRGVAWRVVSGPVTLRAGGIAVAGSVSGNETALISARFAEWESHLGLNIVDAPYEANPLSWEPEDIEKGPYRFWLGVQPTTLSLVATETIPHHNPGQLEMGRTYFYQVFDSLNNDVTPGGPGIKTFRTALYRPDISIGNRRNVPTHRGNNVYNSTGINQTLKITLNGRKNTKVFFSVGNDGDSVDHHTVRASRARRILKPVRYFRLTMGRMNVTAEVFQLGFTQPRVNPGSVFLYQIQAKSRSSRAVRQAINLVARSVSDARALDVGRARFTATVKEAL
jgi:hypothetical protein